MDTWIPKFLTEEEMELLREACHFNKSIATWLNGCMITGKQNGGNRKRKGISLSNYEALGQ